MTPSAARLRGRLLSLLGLSLSACRSEPAQVVDAEPPAAPDHPAVSSPSSDRSQAPIAQPMEPAEPAPLAVPLKCTNPQTAAGFVTCANGFSHRPEVVACTLPKSQVHPKDLPGSCKTDADCSERAHGYCVQAGMVRGTHCAYSCKTDSDCDAGQLCHCGDVPRCVPASCRSDADCAGELLCASYEKTLAVGCPPDPSFACQNPKDECLGNSDCKDGALCVMGEAGLRVCGHAQVACGRPFLVDGHARVAPIVGAGRAEWGAPLPAGLDGVTARERASLAEHWARLAAMEHASIAAFARFVMQLLSLGAPAELVAAATQAMQDEQRHTELCLGLASRYAGRALKPGKLGCHNALAPISLRQIVELVVREGCIGETVAALEAQEAAQTTADETVRAVLQQIAADETRHAGLCWRFVAWAIAKQPELGDDLLSILEGEKRAAGAPVSGHERPGIPEHGVLSERALARLRQDALTAVVLPIARRLVQSGSKGGLAAWEA